MGNTLRWIDEEGMGVDANLGLIGVLWGKVRGEGGGHAKEWIERGKGDVGRWEVREAIGSAAECVVRGMRGRDMVGEEGRVLEGVMGMFECWGGGGGFVREFVEWGCDRCVDKVVYRCWKWGWEEDSIYVMTLGTRYGLSYGRTWGGVEWEGKGWGVKRGKERRLWDLVIAAKREANR